MKSPINKQSEKKQITQSVNCFGHLCVVMNVHDNYLQSIRETIVTHKQFSPKTLFNYLADGKEELTIHQITNIMKSNGENIEEGQVKIIFNMYGEKDRMNYKSYLNFLYPYRKESLGKINIRMYDKNEGKPISQEILCLTMMLFKGEINFLYEFQEAKKQLLPNMNRQKIKKLFQELKDAGRDADNRQARSGLVITHNQLHIILKELKQTSHCNFKAICRKFSSSDEISFITLDQLIFWLKPWQRLIGIESNVNLPNKSTMMKQTNESSERGSIEYLLLND